MGEVSPLVFSWLPISCVTPWQPIWWILLSFPPSASTNHEGFSNKLTWELGRGALEDPHHSINCQIDSAAELILRFLLPLNKLCCRTGLYEKEELKENACLWLEAQHCVWRMSVCLRMLIMRSILFFILIIILPVTKQNYHSSGIMTISNPAAVELPNENFLCCFLTQAAFSDQRSAKTEQCLHLGWARALEIISPTLHPVPVLIRSPGFLIA